MIDDDDDDDDNVQYDHVRFMWLRQEGVFMPIGFRQYCTVVAEFWAQFASRKCACTGVNGAFCVCGCLSLIEAFR